MSRRKRSSKTLEKAERRLAGLKSINSSLDLGNGLTVESYTTRIEDARAKLESYNTALSSVDKAYNDILEAERVLGDLSEHMLLGVASKFGKSSDEYEMAGGVRKTSRRRSNRNPQIATATA
ncbi:MAG TPA: hypothetical protein V6D10_15505 [Trichocoleus sp.]|jgi:hypothetical protein